VEVSDEALTGALVADVDPVIHAVSRLRIMTALMGLDPGLNISFSRLRAMLDMTPGNLLAQLQTLGAARYVSLEQHGRGRGSVTLIAATPEGRAAYTRYASTIRSMLSFPV